MLIRLPCALGVAATGFGVLFAGGDERATLRSVAPAEAPIDHIVVLFQENRSFDHYFGHFPGADGLANARVPPTDTAGRRSPPFDLGAITPPRLPTADPPHEFFRTQRQFGPGRRMDRWVAEGGAGGLPMGYYGREANPLQWTLAEEFVLFDRWFQPVHGASLPNHLYLIAGRTGVYPDTPKDLPEEIVDRQGHIVGNLLPWYAPTIPEARRAPPQTFPTIGDRLAAAGITWAWYQGGWNGGQPAVLGSAGYVPHHNPFTYFKQVMEDPAMRAHLQDITDFRRALEDGTLSRVAFLKAAGPDDAHAGYSTVTAGDRWVGEMVAAVMQSRYWARVAILLTYDESGGWYDHVPPPVEDAFGPGPRVPALLVSPYAKRGYVAHGRYDHTAVLKLIEWRFGLPPLADRDRAARAPLEAFDFLQPPRPPLRAVRPRRLTESRRANRAATRSGPDDDRGGPGVGHSPHRGDPRRADAGESLPAVLPSR